MARSPDSRDLGNGVCAILGAGSLGRLWAARLPSDTTGLLARPGAPEAGDTLTYRFQATDGHWQTVERPWLFDLDDVSLLLVTTKAGDTLDALNGVLPRLPDHCPIVLFQNGLGSQQAVTARWPERPVMAATTTEAANRPTTEQVVHAAAGETWVGALTEPARPLVRQVVEALSGSGLTVIVESDILKRLWNKLVINAGINPFTALLDCLNGEILGEPLFQEHIDDLCAEIHDLMEAEGLAPSAPMALRQQIEAVALATARNTSSMRGDVLNGRSTEIDYINGYVARRSRERNLPAPVNQMLTDRVKALVPHPNPERSS